MTPSPTVAYDANGNTLTDAQGRTFTWDFENRLTQVINPGVGTTTFRYDPFGRRIQKSGPLGTTNYLYDDSNLIEEVDSGGNLISRYTHSPGIDEPLAQLRSGSTSYYDADGLGSITSLTASTGTILGTYGYDAFGSLIGSTGSTTNSFRYTGREFDAETGLFEYRNRYYDPSTGRFISEDPTEYEGGINYYNYARNNPANLVDPLGLDGHTWGPITIYTNQQNMTATEIAAERAHEKQHRCDFWNGNVFWRSCQFLESRGFAAEIPILQQRINQLRSQQTLTLAETQELQQLIQELEQAQGLSDPNGFMIRIYCNVSSSSPTPYPDHEHFMSGW